MHFFVAKFLSIAAMTLTYVRHVRHRTRGRVRAEPSLQLGIPAYSWVPQLTAGYTVNTYSKPPLYYTLDALAPLLPCLRTAAVLRTAHTLGPGGPLPHADTTYRLTNQPTNRTAAVLPVPSCKLEI